MKSGIQFQMRCNDFPDGQVHEANMGPTWVLSAPDGPHVGPMNIVIKVNLSLGTMGSSHYNGTRAICPLMTPIPCESHNHHDISKHICYLFSDGKGGGHPDVFIAAGGSIPWQWEHAMRGTHIFN